MPNISLILTSVANFFKKMAVILKSVAKTLFPPAKKTLVCDDEDGNTCYPSYSSVSFPYHGPSYCCFIIEGDGIRVRQGVFRKILALNRYTEIVLQPKEPVKLKIKGQLARIYIDGKEKTAPPKLNSFSYTQQQHLKEEHVEIYSISNYWFKLEDAKEIRKQISQNLRF